MFQKLAHFLDTHRAWFGFRLAVLMSIAATAIAYMQPELLEKIELRLLDERFILRGPIPADRRVVILAVDDNSLDEIGRWPWPRDKISRIVERVLGTYGARVIGFDAVFSEAQENPLSQSLQLLSEASQARKDVTAWLARHRNLGDLDAKFEALIGKYSDRIVLGYFFYPRGAAPPSRVLHALSQEAELLQPSAISATVVGEGPTNAISIAAIEGNLPRFTQAADVAGFFNFFPDADGLVRRVPLLAELNGVFFPSLDLQVLRVALGWPPVSAEVSEIGVESLTIGDHALPVSLDGTMLLNHYGPGRTFTHVPAADVLKGRADPALFRDAIVLFGVTAIGVYDSRPTPFDAVFPGVEGHAATIANILNGQHVERPVWIEAAELLGVLLLGLICGRIVGGRGPVVQSLTMLGVPFLLLAGAVWLFSTYGIWVKVVYLFVGVLMSTVPSTLIGYVVEAYERSFIHDAFAHYLAPDVVDELAHHPELLHLGGEERVLTAFFSDIASFSTFSEKLTPEELVRFLNKYLTAMSDIILARGGTIDKYEGDAIIAFFGAPLDMPDHAYQCTMAAIEQQRALVDLRKQWTEEGLPEVHIRIGLNSGPIVVGNMGTEDRMDYTMMGDNVNLASRLEGVCKQYHVPILISGDTFHMVEDRIVARFVDRVHVVGRATPVDLYVPLGESGDVPEEQLEMAAAYREAWERMVQRDFPGATERFEKLLARYPGDEPARMLLARAQEFVQSPPPEDWDGVHTLKEK